MIGENPEKGIVMNDKGEIKVEPHDEGARAVAAAGMVEQGKEARMNQPPKHDHDGDEEVDKKTGK